MRAIMKGIVDEEVGGNYLYHATSAGGLKSILQSGVVQAATGPQLATRAQTKMPTVSVTRDWGYASGSNATQQMGGIGRDAILVFDRSRVENNFKTLGTSQSSEVRGLAYNPNFGGKEQNQSLQARTIAKKKYDYAQQSDPETKASYNTPKAGGEFEEAVVVPKGGLPIKGTLVGFWVNPESSLTKDPEIMNNPFRLDKTGPNKFVKAAQSQPVNEEELDENLRKWFKEKWVRFGPDGKIRGACARGDDSEGKPKCLPQKKAQNLGKKGRKYAASKKRREDPNPERTGKAKNVATKKKTNEDQDVVESNVFTDARMNAIKAGKDTFVVHGKTYKVTGDTTDEREAGIEESRRWAICPNCGGEMVSEELMNEKQDACYHKVKSRYKVWPSAYASGALVQCRKKGASNWGTGGKKNESNIMKGLVDEAKAKPYVKPFIENGKQVGWKSSDGYHVKYWQMFAKDSAIKHAKINPDEVQEDYTGEFAAEKTPAINPYGGLKDNKFRGAISETPTDNPTGASGEGGWRKYKPKPAGELEEDTAYAGGMGQGGNAGESYRKFKPKSAGTFKEDELDEACWKGYHKEGNKKMFGKTYPNCVKNTNEEEQLDEKCWDTHKQVGMKNKGGKQVPNCVPKESAIMKGIKR